VRWVVNEECHLARGLVGVRWSEMAEVADGRLSRKDLRVGGTFSVSEKLNDEVSSPLL
jgi:hypothetical protein